MGRFVAVALVLLGAFGTAPASGRISLSGGDGWVRVDTPPRAEHVIVHVQSGGVALRSRPFGPVIAHVGATTPFGSPRALGVVTTSTGRWLGVSDPSLGNGRLGWIDATAGDVSYSRTHLDVEIDLSSRTLVVRRDGVAIRRTTVGIGRSGSPTPTGRFAVTDKLNGPSYSRYYGCCILALSATQPNLPAGWTGGNRIAIHGTLSASDFGHAVSAGCVHAAEADLRFLMRSLPLGTPVVIRP